MGRLQINEINLQGADRTIRFSSGMNIVRGPITTGKTTLVRILRGFLGSLPSEMAPEVSSVVTVFGDVTLDSGRWQVARPWVSTPTAKVELLHDSEGLRLPALRPDAANSLTYADWLLAQLGLPKISVPSVRSDAASAPTPVTINDWLAYCLIPGDEIDTSVFGHTHPYRDSKRRYVFELIYGRYDAQAAALQERLRKVERELNVLQVQGEATARFLHGTELADGAAVERALAARRSRIAALHEEAKKAAVQMHAAAKTEDLRLEIQRQDAAIAATMATLFRTKQSLADLRELRTQLGTQASRLTRAIVANEWLVDFDFMVCPRCGQGLNHDRADAETCYLCLQPLEPSESRGQETLIREQDRIQSQAAETDQVIKARTEELQGLHERHRQLKESREKLSNELDSRLASFVSARAVEMTAMAEERARLAAEEVKYAEYAQLLKRQEATAAGILRLQAEREDVLAELEARAIASSKAEGNIRALEARFLEYLNRLNVPRVSEQLTATIDRRTYLPVVSGRKFEELSSQGLEVMVNVGHALAHHTVAIDRALPLPGLLVLDGLSSNVGHEGYDQERVNDMYALIQSVCDQYQDSLQVIVVDHDVPTFAQERIVLTLAQNDRLIRSSHRADPS